MELGLSVKYCKSDYFGNYETRNCEPCPLEEMEICNNKP